MNDLLGLYQFFLKQGVAPSQIVAEIGKLAANADRLKSRMIANGWPPSYVQGLSAKELFNASQNESLPLATGGNKLDREAQGARDFETARGGRASAAQQLDVLLRQADADKIAAESDTFRLPEALRNLSRLPQGTGSPLQELIGEGVYIDPQYNPDPRIAELERSIQEYAIPSRTVESERRDDPNIARVREAYGRDPEAAARFFGQNPDNLRRMFGAAGGGNFTLHGGPKLIMDADTGEFDATLNENGGEGLSDLPGGGMRVHPGKNTRLSAEQQERIVGDGERNRPRHMMPDGEMMMDGMMGPRRPTPFATGGTLTRAAAEAFARYDATRAREGTSGREGGFNRFDRERAMAPGAITAYTEGPQSDPRYGPSTGTRFGQNPIGRASYIRDAQGNLTATANADPTAFQYGENGQVRHAPGSIIHEVINGRTVSRALSPAEAASIASEMRSRDIAYRISKMRGSFGSDRTPPEVARARAEAFWGNLSDSGGRLFFRPSDRRAPASGASAQLPAGLATAAGARGGVPPAGGVVAPRVRDDSDVSFAAPPQITATGARGGTPVARASGPRFNPDFGGSLFRGIGGLAAGGDVKLRAASAIAVGKALRSNPFAHPDMVNALLAGRPPLPGSLTKRFRENVDPVVLDTLMNSVFPSFGFKANSIMREAKTFDPRGISGVVTVRR